MTIQSVLDLITASARKIGAIQQGQTISGSEAADAFLALNGLMDQLNAARENLWFIPQVTQALTIGQQKYQIGTGAPDFNMPRPAEIQTASVIVGAFSWPVDIITVNEWMGIDDLSRRGNKIDKMYWDHGFPSGIVSVWPIPGAAMFLSMGVWSPLPTFSALTDQVNLPPAYWEYLVYALAVRIAPEYGNQIDQSLVLAMDQAAKAAMQRLNTEVLGPALAQRSTPVVGYPPPPAPPAQ